MSTLAKFGGCALGGLLLAAAAAAPAFAQDRQPGVDPSAPHPVIYPMSAQRSGEEGMVAVSVYVKDDGKVGNARLVHSSGYDDLDTAGVQTALNWKYLPAIHGGEPTGDWTTVEIVYKLPNGP